MPLAEPDASSVVSLLALFSLRLAPPPDLAVFLFEDDGPGVVSLGLSASSLVFDDASCDDVDVGATASSATVEPVPVPASAVAGWSPLTLAKVPGEGAPIDEARDVLFLDDDSPPPPTRSACVCTDISLRVLTSAGGGEGVSFLGTGVVSLDSVGLGWPSQTCAGPTREKAAEHGFSLPSWGRGKRKSLNMPVPISPDTWQ